MRKFLITTTSTNIKESRIINEDEVEQYLDDYAGPYKYNKSVDFIFEIPQRKPVATSDIRKGVKNMHHAIGELPNYISMRVWTTLDSMYRQEDELWATRPVPEIHSRLELSDLLNKRHCGKKTINAIADMFADNGLEPKWQHQK